MYSEDSSGELKFRNIWMWMKALDFTSQTSFLVKLRHFSTVNTYIHIFLDFISVEESNPAGRHARLLN